MTGRTIAHYEILEKLGEGGMGVVYKARDTHLNRLVAIKVLPPEKTADPERKRRFVQEAKAASALNHPNIVTIHDIGSEQGADFIVMELVAGKPLDELIARKPPRLNDTLGYAVQIADALAAAHGAGIVHRDLKPSNIMVGDDGRVRVLDFGLAKLTARADPDSAETATAAARTEEGTVLGTVAYMSPEQAEGKPVDARSDIFSFGLVLYEMLTGRHPFRRESRMSTLAAILNEEVKPLSELSPSVAPEIERTVLRCLRKDPQRRWQSMSDLKTVLEDLKEESESGKLRTAGGPPARRRAAWAWMAIGGVAVAALVAAGLYLWPAKAPSGGRDLELTRLTLDSGFTSYPTISGDGRIMAFASDRSGEGPPDIWVRHLDRPQPTRRTHDPAGAYMPSISPDGSRIAFRSNRDGGGVYIMDTLGGEERRLAPHCIYPRFSPDGKWIVCVRQPASTFSIVLHKMFLVSPEGGELKPFQPEFGAVLQPQGIGPIWSPDGRHLLFKGARAKDKEADWWVAPVDGGPAVSTGAARSFPVVSGPRLPCAWPAENTLIVAQGTTIEGINLFRMGIAADRQITAKPERLTSGPGMRYEAAVAGDGTLLFPILNWLTNIWSIRLDTGKGQVEGKLEPVTADATTKVFASVSRDGSKLAHTAVAGTKPMRIEVRLRDIASGRETVFSRSGDFFKVPRLSPDGSLLCFQESAPEGRTTFVASTASGERRTVCVGCRVLGFFPGGEDVLATFGPRLLRRRLTNGQETVLTALQDGVVTGAQLSADGRWIAVAFDTAAGKSGIWVVPVKETPVPREDWILVSESDTAWHSEPAWSPDGTLLYYLSERDGPPCVWARRLDATTRKPAAESFAVYHAHGMRPGFWGPRGFYSLSMARDRMFLLMSETTANVWMAKLPLK
jgi:serine/threonine protein kinase